MTLLRVAMRSTLLVAAIGSVLRAQCPDGAPPPCKGATPSIIRRTIPALNPRAWIVVPFGNAMKAQDLEWLRDGSANLLSLDMGRWTDINVVPDKRVGDLLRELPATRSADALTLNDGLAVARRAGAGQLVMGDFFRVGKGARLVASVFDVKTGARVRTVTQQAVEPDSLLTAFGPLARGVLALPPPADAKTGDIGTSSLDAYQSYLLGVKALNRFDMPEARKHLTRALAIDSLFALAHLQFANVLEWGDLSGGQQAKEHALAAQRLGATLPRRERMLIEAGVASAKFDYTRVCAVANALVARDSTDIQGMFLLGECSFHDDALVPSGRDTTTRVFRGNWNTAIRSFTRVIQLDPTYLGAFEHIIDMLQRTGRSAFDCGPGMPQRRNCPEWTSYVLRTGDTLETVAVRERDAAAVAVQYDRWRKERPTLANHVEAARIAQQWFDLDPNSEGARIALARTAQMRGDLAGAYEQSKRVTPRTTPDNLVPLRMKLEIAAKLGKGAEARAIFDSLVKTAPDSPGNDAPRGAIDLMFGRFARFERAGAAAAMRLGPEAVAYQRHVGRALLGQPKDGMARDEATFFASMRDSSCNERCRLTRIMPTVMYSLHVPGVALPSLLTDSTTLLLAARALAHGDAAQLRRAATSLEAEARSRAAAQITEVNSVVAADAYVALGDSASALRMARFFVDSSMAFVSISSYFVQGLAPANGAALWPRMMLLRADLAAAAGAREEARTWYARVLDLWADADPELQPTVARIRAALAALRS